MRYLVLSLATLTCALGLLGSSQVGRRAAGNGRLHAGAGPAGQRRLQGILRPVPRREPRGRRRAGAHGAGLPGRMALAPRGRTAARDRRDDATGQSRFVEPAGRPSASRPTSCSATAPPPGPQELTANATATVSEILAAKPAISAPPVLGQVVEGRYGPGGPREILTIGEGPFASLMDPAAQARFKEIRKPLDALTPVTEAMLRNPSPNDWLIWRRNYRRLGLQRADQINRDNVKDLTVSWTWSHELQPGSERVHAAGARRHHVHVELRRAIQALDARNRQPAVAVPPDDCRPTTAADVFLPHEADRWRSAATSSSCRRPTCTSLRSTSRPARWCGTSSPTTTRRPSGSTTAARWSSRTR